MSFVNVEPSAHKRDGRSYFALSALVVVSYCCWVLSLPLFPMQDGPMHLYFTHVLRSLIADPNGFYGQFYFIRHFLPPYALYYYLLIFFSSFLSPLMADKLIICLYFVSFAFGFRYLARMIGPSGDIAALLATTLLLNWPLGMGFVNFCLSTSFMFWALGLWCRAAGRQDTGRKLLFVLLAYLIMFTHPVPLLGLLGFCVIELTVRLVRARRARRGNPNIHVVPNGWLRDAVYVVVASGSLLYVRLFTTAHIARQIHISPQSPLRQELSLLKGFVLLHSLTAFAGKGAADMLYRILVYALVIAGFCAAVFQLRRAWSQKTWLLADTWSLICIVVIAGFPFVPSDLNNSAYFAARLVLYVWIAALLAAAGVRLSRRWQRAVAVSIALASTVLILVMAHQRIDPIANEIATLETGQPSPANQTGLLLHDPGYRTPSTITYDPYFWNGVRILRRSNSLMYNTPWLDLAIIPLGPRSFMPTYKLTPNDLEYPPGLQKTLADNDPLRRQVLSAVNFTIIGFGRKAADPAYSNKLLRSGYQPALENWTCQAYGMFDLCTKHPAAVGTSLVDRSRPVPLPVRAMDWQH